MPKYCIIGAGAAGLAALKIMSDQGFDVDCFERTGRVGGHWNTDYDALHLITSRNLSGYDDYPMPAHWPNFPSRDQLVEYYNAYADRFGLRDRITFNVEVADARPTHADNGAGGWTVTLADGSVHAYDGVLVANGHLWAPKVPGYPGEYTGKQLHSAQYTNTDDIEGDRVLVVGTGNSGCDLAVDAAQHRIRTSVSVRQGHYYQPKTFFGKPRSEIAFLGELSPSEFDLATRLLMRVTVGTPAEYGLPMPERETLAENAPIVNDLMLYWIQHGRIEVRPAIERFDGLDVHFSDGTVEEYSTVLWATGFSPRIPFLPQGLIREAGDVPLRQGGAIVPAGLEKLYLVGLIAPRGAQAPVYQIQTRLITRMLRLHEEGKLPHGIGPLLAHQEPDDRIDIVRTAWLDQIDDTERAVRAVEEAA
ncbi:MAG: NAD(P)-binding domain-containing protein [Microbacterium sp.]|uniref:flavin-containing monooxygenase n=1 Tax=Microbacterium sp. TaxID=51671 RepID=UPI0039E607D8